MHGDVFGGWIMSQVDIAGSVPATCRANGRVATIAVNSFVFKHPVFVGDLLSFYARIIKTGNTSVTVDVEVYAQRLELLGEVVKVTEATLTYVATGNDRRPRTLPPLKPQSGEGELPFAQSTSPSSPNSRNAGSSIG